MHRQYLATCFVIAVSIASVMIALPVCEGKEDSPGFSVRKNEVSFTDGSALLQGTVFLPEIKANVPGVVILGGAERGPRNPYKEGMAAFFASNGIAALIYDSPGTGRSTGNALLQTKDDRVREAANALHFLCAQEGVNAKEVGIWGISEGANIALLAAARERSAAFAISISSALGVSPVEISRFRIEMTGHELGLARDDISRALVLEEILYELFSGADMAEWRLVKMKTKSWPDEPWSELIDAVNNSRRAQSPQERQEILETLRRVMMPWKEELWFELAVVDVRRFSQIFTLDAARFFAFLEKNPWAQGDWNDHLRAMGDMADLRCPVLALWGEKDNFLPPQRSAATLKRLLVRGGQDLTVEIIPRASHTMTYSGSNDFAGGYTSLMVDWLKARFGIPSPGDE